MIGIIDIGAGNLGSISQAIYKLGFDFCILTNSNEIPEVTHLILPGVGSYDAVMDHLQATKMIEPIKNFADSGRPILGICVGMQILSDFGEEGRGAEGIGLIPGRVVRMDFSQDHGYPLPHIGWNQVDILSNHPIFEGVSSGLDFYYVNSYCFSLQDMSYQIATTPYKNLFCAAVAKYNVVGVQFHPEKSQKNGLKLIENFCHWDGKE